MTVPRILIPPALVLAIAILSLMMGEIWIGPSEMWQALTTGQDPAAMTLTVLRGPRVITALGAGAVLGLSGAIFQLMLRNPLASPDVMGFNAGGGLAIIGAVAAGLSLPMPLIAAAGGIASAGLVAALAHRRGQPASPLVLILVGLGMGFTASGLAGFLMLTLPDALAFEARRWTTGSLAARSWEHAAQVWAIGGALMLALILQIRRIELLELGRELAAGLGLRVGRAQGLVLATAVLLAASGVAVAGPVPFVALMAGPVGIGLGGARGPGARLFCAACAGAAICAGADLLARSLMQGVQLPVGVMTGILGAPYLLWLLSREVQKGKI